MRCVVCGKRIRVMAFKGTPWCCNLHRKPDADMRHEVNHDEETDE